MTNISIIGSGFGGLSAALYAAKAGHTVHVYEKNEQLGGRASVYKKGDFRRDMGPSRYLMPDLFTNFFKEFGYDVNKLLDLEKLSPSYRIYFAGKDKPVDVFDNIEKNRKTFEALEPGATDQLKKYVKDAQYQYEVAMKEFVPKNYNNITDFFTWRMLTEGMKLHIFTTIGRYAKRYFKSDEMQKIVQYPMVFLGSPPYETPAIYNLMTYVDFGMGVWYPKGGIGKIVDALVHIGKKLGVQYHTNSEIIKINVSKGNNIDSITIDEKEIVSTDLVISNADMPRTETHLLDKQWQSYPETYRQKKQIAPSAFLIYLGVKGKIHNLKHHTLLFADDRKKNNEEIFTTKQTPSDPSFYICCPSKTDTTVAPPDDENLFILVPFPPDVTLTDAQQQKYAEKVLHITEKTIRETFTDRIIHQRIFTAKDFASRYHAYQGTALGLAHTFFQTAIFRPNNVSKKVSGLFYTGSYTNPGIGMPMCLLSGKLTYERVITYLHKHQSK